MEIVPDPGGQRSIPVCRLPALHALKYCLPQSPAQADPSIPCSHQYQPVPLMQSTVWGIEDRIRKREGWSHLFPPTRTHTKRDQTRNINV